MRHSWGGGGPLGSTAGPAPAAGAQPRAAGKAFRGMDHWRPGGAALVTDRVMGAWAHGNLRHITAGVACTGRRTCPRGSRATHGMGWKMGMWCQCGTGPRATLASLVRHTAGVDCARRATRLHASADARSWPGAIRWGGVGGGKRMSGVCLCPGYIGPCHPSTQHRWRRLWAWAIAYTCLGQCEAYVIKVY